MGALLIQVWSSDIQTLTPAADLKDMQLSQDVCLIGSYAHGESENPQSAKFPPKSWADEEREQKKQEAR